MIMVLLVSTLLSLTAIAILDSSPLHYVPVPDVMVPLPGTGKLP